MTRSSNVLFLSIFFLLISCTKIIAQDGSTNTDLQSQNFNDPFGYRIIGLVYVKTFDADERKPEDDQKIARPGLIFNIVAEEVNKTTNASYYVIQFPPITDHIVTMNDTTTTLKGNSDFVNSDNNDDYHWMEKSALDGYMQGGFIRKSHKTFIPNLTYGGHVTLPFKLRPKIDTLNFRLTKEIMLGGYLGAKWRISQYQPFYLSFPIISLGLATLDFDNETNPNNATVGNGTVLGITGSFGGIFQLNDFQFGFLMGWDKAAGQIGKSWIYNGKHWFSFSVGYTFIGDDPTPKTGTP